jgi:MFS family permease
VSLLMDASSELVHSLLPLLLVQGLGASALAVGLLEGAAEATAQVTKLFSGVLSDRLGRRKALVVAGYGLAALTKPLFPLADTVGLVFAARLVDRVGKGVRGAPRDALIADISPPEVRGAAYGLRQALDTVGAVIGPLLAVGLMLLLAGDIRAVLWRRSCRRSPRWPCWCGAYASLSGLRLPPARRHGHRSGCASWQSWGRPIGGSWRSAPR